MLWMTLNSIVVCLCQNIFVVFILSTKNENPYLNTLLHYLLFLLSDFITVSFVLPDKHKTINSQSAHARESNKNLEKKGLKIWITATRDYSSTVFYNEN